MSRGAPVLSVAFDSRACRAFSALAPALTLGFYPKNHVQKSRDSLLTELWSRAEEIYVVSSYDGVAINRRLVLTLKWGDKRRELSMALALLGRVMDNPLLLMDGRLAVYVPDVPKSPGVSASYSCDVVGQLPPCTVPHSSSELALTAHLCRGNRMGVSLAIACCQSLLALHAVEANIRGLDLAVAVAGFLVSAAKLRAKPTSLVEYELTTSTWARQLNLIERTPEQTLEDARGVASMYEGTVEQVIREIRDSAPEVFSAVFGRVKGLLERGKGIKQQVEEAKKAAEESLDGNYDQTLMFLTEQTNLLDIELASGLGDQLVLLYSPLTLANRMLLQSLTEQNMKKLAIRFAFCTGAPPLLLERTLKGLIGEKRTLIIPGGTPAEYLVAMKLEKGFENVMLLKGSWPPKTML